MKYPLKNLKLFGFFLILFRIINSNFIMDLIKHVFLDFQDIFASPGINIYPLLDFESVM